MTRHLLALLCTSISIISVLHAAGADQNALPSLWDDTELENASQSSGVFRILSEIHLDDKASYLLEEWFDGPAQAFRLDLLTRHENGTSGVQVAKKSIIVRGATSERHFFTPFQCSPFENLSWALGPNLGTKLAPRKAASDLAVGGMGAIWLFATSESAKPAEFRPAKAPLDGSLRNKRSRARVMRTFDEFTVAESPGFPFEIKFYFLPGQWLTPDGRYDPEALQAIHLVDPKENSLTKRVKLAATVLEVEVRPGALRQDRNQADLFELPLGYGCTRATSPDVEMKSGRAEYASPVHCLDSLEPHLCNIEALVQLPSAPGDDLDRWRSHASSLRIASGQLLGRQYLALEGRDFSGPLAGGPSSMPRRAILQRTKRVWDLGQAGPEGGEYSDRYAENPSEPPEYFELAEHLHSCHAHGNARLNELPSLEFSLFQPDQENDEDEEEEGGADGPPQVVRTTVGLSLVDEETLHELFRDTRDFHFVRESATPWLRYREFHHEKRIERLEMRDRSGQVGWAGPVSLVRRWYYADTPTGTSNSDGGSPHDEVPAEVLSVRLTIYLFASKSYDRQVGRIQLTMNAGQRLDVAQLHRELNIEPCLQRSPTDNFRFHVPLNGDSSPFALVYPLDSPEAVHALALQSQWQDAIYGKFLEILGGEKLLTSSESFNVMQLTDLQVDVESNLVSVSGRLHRWPEIYNYARRPNAWLAAELGAKRLRQFLSELRPTSESCAQSCSHYSCGAFAWDQISRLCELYLSTGTAAPIPPSPRNQTAAGAKSAKAPLVSPRFEPYRTVCERKSDSRRPVAPRTLLDRMRDWIERGAGGSDLDNELDALAQNPLALELGAEFDPQATRLVLLPSSLSLGSDLREKVDLLLSTSRPSSEDSSGPEEAGQEGEQWVRPEFELLFNNRKFKAENFHHPSREVNENFPLEEATSIADQWACERLCEEHDCRSYSYCQMSQTCLVSKLHAQSAIEATSETSSFCMLLAREYLSKFDKFPSQIGEGETSELKRQLNREEHTEQEARLLQLDSARDCAISCMEWTNFTCRSFVFCPASECFLFGLRHPLGLLAKRNTSSSAAAAAVGAKPTSSATCDLYQRSFLVDYEQFYGKRLALGGGGGGETESAGSHAPAFRLLHGLGAEECASACSQRIDQDEQQEACGAFHVCLSQPAQGKRAQLLCGLLTVDADTPSVKVRDLLLNEPACSAFVSNTLGSSSAYGQTSGPGSLPAPSQTHSTSLALGLLLTLVGLALGYTLTWLIALQGLVTYPAILMQSLRLR